MLPTFTDFNRVVSEPLRTEWEKELRNDVFVNGVAHSYYVYTRTRTKRWKYVGLSRAAADVCSDYLNSLLNRRVKRQMWSPEKPDELTPAGIWKWMPATANIWDSAFDRIVCGEAKPSHVEAHLWEVNAELNEVVTFRGKATSAQKPTIETDAWLQALDSIRWREFEMNPEGRFGNFAGGNYTIPFVDDFDYDERIASGFEIFSVYRDPADQTRLFVNANYNAVGPADNLTGVTLRWDPYSNTDEFGYVATSLGNGWFEVPVAAAKIKAYKGSVETQTVILKNVYRE